MAFVQKTMDVVHKTYHTTQLVNGNPSNSFDNHFVSHRVLNTHEGGEWRDAQAIIHGSKHTAEFRKLVSNMDIGHGFGCVGHTYKDTAYHVDAKAFVAGANRTYTGDIHAYTGSAETFSPVWPDTPVVLDSDMFRDGAVAVSQVLPANSSASCYVAVGEILRDGVPSAPFLLTLKNRLQNFRDLGREYLNVEFGWKPFISDFRNTMNAVRNSHSLLSQYERDSGRNVRRRFYFPTITDSSTVSGSKRATAPTVSPGGVFPALNTTFDYSKTTTSTTKQWFSGCFTHYLARDTSVLGRMARAAQEANYLYGIFPTPDNLWKAEPWTWATDWFVDAGAVVHNISALTPFSQVMRYGYIMCEKSTEVTHTLRTGPVLGLDLSQTFGSYSKQRRRATPYGFGLNPDAFTASHWAIIAALGISRAPTMLNGWP